MSSYTNHNHSTFITLVLWKKNHNMSTKKRLWSTQEIEIWLSKVFDLLGFSVFNRAWMWRDSNHGSLESKMKISTPLQFSHEIFDVSYSRKTRQIVALTLYLLSIDKFSNFRNNSLRLGWDFFHYDNLTRKKNRQVKSCQISNSLEILQSFLHFSSLTTWRRRH